MKKTLSIVLVAVVAAVLVGYGAVTLLHKGDVPTIEAGTPSSETFYRGETEPSEVNGAENTETSSEAVSENASEAVPTTARSIISEIFSRTEKTTAVIKTTARQTAAPTATQAASGYKYAYAGFNPSYADVSGTAWNLILVNRDYILPDNYTVKLAPAITSDPDGEQLDYRAAPHYNEMYLAAKKDGIDLEPVSGYRSVKRQTNNFENKIETYMDQGYSKIEATQMAATIILPPGTSEHNAGLAMDICSLYESFDKTDEYKWLCENAADYGFILRYPKDKVNKTKIVYEPWHWRYVGVETAKRVKASGLCYEEFLGLA